MWDLDRLALLEVCISLAFFSFPRLKWTAVVIMFLDGGRYKGKVSVLTFWTATHLRLAGCRVPVLHVRRLHAGGGHLRDVDEHGYAGSAGPYAACCGCSDGEFGSGDCVVDWRGELTWWVSLCVDEVSCFGIGKMCCLGIRGLDTIVLASYLGRESLLL